MSTKDSGADAATRSSSASRRHTRRDDAATRAVILDAAVKILEEHGVEAVRIADIARAANVGAPTVYYYFDGKEDLVEQAQSVRLSLALAFANEMSAILGAAVATADLVAFREGLRSFMTGIYSPTRNDGIWVMLDAIATRTYREVPHDHIGESFNTFFENMCDVIRGAQSHGWMTKAHAPEMLLQFYLGAFLGSAAVRGVIPSPGEVDDLVAFILFSLDATAATDHGTLPGSLN